MISVAHAATGVPFYQDENFWVLVAFVVFVVLVWRAASRAIGGLLDKRAETIRTELEEARRLREEASAALADYQRRQREALKEAEDILAHARVEAERMGARAAVELENQVKRREQMAMDRIAQAEAEAVRDVRAQAVDLAIAATRRLLGDAMTGERATGLVDDAIADLPKRLN